MRRRDLYADELGVGLDLERNWWAYEERLPAAIDALVAAQRVSGHDWLHVLVPFATSLLARGPEFDTRFDRRVDSQGGDLGADRMPNATRVMEIQRLLGVVMACRWVIAESSRPLVANDVGWTSSVDASGRSGVALPLDPGHVLVLTPAWAQRILNWDAAGGSQTSTARR